MNVAKIELDRSEARRLQHEYKAHRAFQTEQDREIERTYRLIAAGKVVIQARESIRLAGLGADGFPKLALTRADAKTCRVQMATNGECRMWMDDGWMPRAESKRVILPPGTFPERKDWAKAEGVVPLIPVHLRPKTALENYHILWEAEWRRVVPRDPYLLRHVGGDIWIVLAAWDLTEVERAAMATRLSAQ
jgi:hypothetical protein